MKKYIVAAMLSTVAFSGVAFAQTAPITATGGASAVAPANSTEQQVKVLRKQMEDEIKAVRAKYQTQIDALRKAAKDSAAELRAQRAKDAAEKRAKEKEARKNRGGVTNPTTATTTQR